MTKCRRFLFLIFVCVAVLFQVNYSNAKSNDLISVTDSAGREVKIPSKITRVICSGPGCLRYLTYLGAADMVVAVDSVEHRQSRIDARPYAIANPKFKEFPIFGEFRGRDNPELIVALEPQPQVIFKTYAGSGYNPDELQQRTGIPVIVLNYGDLAYERSNMNKSLRIMGKVVGKAERAEAVISFFENTISDLKKRTQQVLNGDKPTCYVGGIAYKGPHGFHSTEPGYPPFVFLNANNVAAPKDITKKITHADIAKEKIVEWNPDYVFVDLSTIKAGTTSNALYELVSDPAYATLSAVKNNLIYGVLPYNWYTANHGSTLANSYFIGKILYPNQFADVDPVKKADSIYSFLVGEPVFTTLNSEFSSLGFIKINPHKVTVDNSGKVFERSK